MADTPKEAIEPTEAEEPCVSCGDPDCVFDCDGDYDAALRTTPKAEGESAELVSDLRAIDEEAMYHAPASTYATCQQAADTIERLQADNDGLREASQTAIDALNAMMNAWFDYHDAHSLTQPVTGEAGNAFDKALAAREKLEALRYGDRRCPQDTGASAEPTGLAGAEAPEPHAGLGPTDGIPSADEGFVYVEWTGKACGFCGKNGVSGKTAEGHTFAGCPDAGCLGYMAAFDFVTVDHARAAWDNRANVFVCSNPRCGVVWDANPNGHCPKCIKPNGVGWSTRTQEIQTLGRFRQSSEGSYRASGTVHDGPTRQGDAQGGAA